MFQGSLSIQLFGLHSPNTCQVKNFKIFTGVFFFILTLSTHVSGFTLHTVTLQAHVRFKIYKFSREFIFFILTLSTHVSRFTLHTVIWFTLSKHMLGSIFLNFHRSNFFSYLHSPHMFQDSLSIQLFGLHSPSTCLVQNFQIFTGDKNVHTYTLHTCFRVHSPYSYLVYTLQAHVRFNIFGFSQDFIFFILTLSTHVSEFTLHAVVVTLSKQMLHFKILYSYYNFIMCLNAPLNHECLTPEL